MRCIHEKRGPWCVYLYVRWDWILTDNPAKTVKSNSYEKRLMEYIVTFKEHRKNLELAFSAHASIGVDVANRKLNAQTHQLQNIEDRLEELTTLFRKLDTPREKDLLRFLEENGGIKVCIANDELLDILISKSGESSSKISGRDLSRKSASDIPAIRKKLFKELAEDIDDILNKNLALYERKLDMQSKQISETIEAESEHIIQTLLSGAHDRIIDAVNLRLLLPSHFSILMMVFNRISEPFGKTW